MVTLSPYGKLLKEHLDKFLKSGNYDDLKIKAGRNDPCPCGSGKKFKKCCIIN